MKMRYLEITDGPMAHPPRLGTQGTMRTMVEGLHVCDTGFELWVDNSYKGVEDAWVVVGVFLAPQESGVHGCTAVVFGKEGREPFADFENAFAFCHSFGKSMFNAPVAEEWVNATVARRGLEAWQYFVPSAALEAGPEEPDAGDDSEGGTRDVTVAVDVPSGRVLH
jgi:hypothetical protein